MGAPPCTPVLPIVCRRRLPPSLPPPSRSRSLLLPRGSTPSGSEDPSWPPCPPSSRCGSPSRSTTSAAHPLSTASASKRKLFCFVYFYLQNFRKPREMFEHQHFHLVFDENITCHEHHHLAWLFCYYCLGFILLSLSLFNFKN